LFLLADDCNLNGTKLTVSREREKGNRDQTHNFKREREATGSTSTIKSLTSLSLFLANVLKHVETRSCSWRRQGARTVLLGFQQIVFIPAQNKWFKKKRQLVACDEAREGS
jgi:hypothetical protein